MPKYKNIFCLSILASAVLLSACQPKSNEPKEPTSPEVVQTEPEVLKLSGDTEKLKLVIPECEGKNCPEISIERLNSNQRFIDEWIDQQILQQLKNILSVDAIEPAKATAASEAEVAASEPKTALSTVTTPKQQLEQQIQPSMQTFLNLDKELKALSASHSISLMIKPKILNSGDPLATVVLNSSHYLGGAHGASAQRYYNFDLEQQTLVKLDDIIAEKQKAKLEAQAYEAFKVWVMESKLAKDVAEYEQAWKFILTDNFYLAKEGLILQYAEYEIGPYVVGLPRLMIPYAQLQGVLKPQYLPQAETAASEARPALASKAE
ncbi:RsiV family protein [Acinetobacter pseudolwoffii]|uniref:RsiV family protein n=1 Tax=Acinetobacter pseudolwoffii TaxID=2053287 RepID=UPI00094523D5|nr:RsiV family protein [Acinetobacter pseudolwoffii]MEE1124251.1 RsiV family protein [Acinetobacter pseudolwoffii]